VTLDDLFPEPSGPRPGAAPARKCPRHDYSGDRLVVQDEAGTRIYTAPCSRCGRRVPLATVRRGRTSLRAGKDAERAIAKAYPGGVRTGHHGGPDDVLVGELFIVQSKAGGWFSERVWLELAKLPRTGGRIPTLIVSDRPGPGHRTRRYVVRTMDDDIALHGGTK